VDEEHDAADDETPAGETPAGETPAGETPAAEASSEAPKRKVQVVFEVNDAAEMANLLASHKEPARRPRPLLGATGAVLGAMVAAVGWYLLQRTIRNEALIAALAVGLLAGIGAAAFGGRCRANQLAAALAALLAVVALRLTWAHFAASVELARALELAGPHTDFARVIAARVAQRVSAGALARGLLDGLGLATYLVVVAVAWRIPRRP
jgi:hypothetical protein